jgi:hypothetical protein
VLQLTSLADLVELVRGLVEAAMGRRDGEEGVKLRRPAKHRDAMEQDEQPLAVGLRWVGGWVGGWVRSKAGLDVAQAFG